MNYNKMSKSELISLLKEKEKQRAFSYEDQMKLLILDQSPFTIWASDRNCIIKFWEGQCEHHYGYTRDEAIGKDFVDLFVDEHEAQTAREDQINIIDNGAVYHNIANDHGKEGNNLYLITNCRRIRDIKTGEIWNAEMGLTIDYLKDEMNRLEQIVAESKRVEQYVSQLKESFKKTQENFINRKTSFRSSITECERLAIGCGKRKDVEEDLSNARKRVTDIDKELKTLVEKFCKKLDECKTYDKCEQTKSDFACESTEILDKFEKVVLDVEEISHIHNNAGISSDEKDALLRDSQLSKDHLLEQVRALLSKADAEVKAYEALDPDPNSDRLKALKNRKNQIERLKKEIEEFFESIYTKLKKNHKEDDIKNLREKMDEGSKHFQEMIEAKDKEF